MRQLLDKIKKKLSLKIMICIGILFILVGGTSLANLSYTIEGENTNLVEAGCLQISVSEQNTINLTDQAPISDNDGKETLPYTYNISNTCTLEAYYETSINVLNTANASNASKIKAYLTGDSIVDPILISNLKEIQMLEKPNDVVKSYLIDSGYLKPNETKSFNLRMWIDYDVESFTGNFDNRIIVNSIADKGPIFDSNTTGYQIIGKQGVNQITILNPNFSLSSEDYNQTSGLYKLVGINDNMTYIFRGNVNNYFKLGKYPKDLTVTYTKSDNTQATITHHAGDDMIWRVVRINEDGSVKLILDDVIGTSNVNNSNTSTTYNNSNLKTVVDNFYNEYLTDIQDKIVQTKFCVCTTSNLPTLRCNSADIVNDNIGLLSADELIAAGASKNKNNTSYYLNKDINGFFTLTPSNAINGNYNYISSLSSNSYANSLVTDTLAIRPVISIENNYILKGTGTISNPYEIVRTIN